MDYSTNLELNNKTLTQHFYHQPATMSSIKGPAPQHHDGSSLRIGIVHARWNIAIIEPLVAGAKAKLLEAGVKESNIVVQSCPGAWELPIAVQR